MAKKKAALAKKPMVRKDVVDKFAHRVHCEFREEVARLDISDCVRQVTCSKCNRDVVVEVSLGNNLYWRATVPYEARKHFSAEMMVDNLCRNVARFAGIE